MAPLSLFKFSNTLWTGKLFSEERRKLNVRAGNLKLHLFYFSLPV